MYRKSRAQRAKEQIEREEFAARWRELNPVPALEAGPCPRHPDWMPAQPGPPVPAALCPRCRDEAEAKRSPRREERELPHPLQARETPPMEAAYAAHREKLREAGVVLPGSAEELAALDRIDDAREDQRYREERRSRGAGQFVCERIEGGRLIQFYAFRDRRGTRFTKVYA
jgi:hypothetical protein